VREIGKDLYALLSGTLQGLTGMTQDRRAALARTARTSPPVNQGSFVVLMDFEEHLKHLRSAEESPCRATPS
jgi:hypothetical protein